MSLDYEWSLESEHRRKKRDKEGVSISEAISSLSTFQTTAWPIATEMAEWIFKNWALTQVYELPEPTRRLLFEIIESRTLFEDTVDREISMDGSFNEQWVKLIVQALENLGGYADLEGIYDEIQTLYQAELGRHWQATVRNCLDHHSLNSPNYLIKNKVFFCYMRGYWHLLPTD